MSTIKTIDDLNVNNQTVLVRADLNVPVQNGQITDTTRIDRLAPTLRELMNKGAKVAVLSHFGRPKGPDQENSLKPIAPALAKAIGKLVAFAADCVGPVAEQAVSKLKSGDVLLLENLRFHPEEEKNDPAFARQLAALGQYYVNDAFSASHRAHASITTLARLLPAAAGRLMQAELETLNKALTNPTRPVMAIVGGAKISTKLELLNNLVKKVNILVLGGGMANTFLEAQGVSLGKSLSEKNMLEQARTILHTANISKCEVVLPVDGIAAKEFKTSTPSRTVSIKSVAADDMILDVGPQTVKAIVQKLESCKTVVWNGPLGAFEIEPFDAGTTAVAKAVAHLTQQKRLMSVAGGGDTLAALAKAGVENSFSYASTAGGAFLEWLEGKELPGVAALKVK